jgi:hypothetical protein
MMDDKPLEYIMDTFQFMCEKFSEDNYSATESIEKACDGIVAKISGM